MKVIFVCKDNLTRSVAAQYCLSVYAERHNIRDIVFDSAGLDLGKFDQIFTAHFEELKKLGVDTSSHAQKLLKQEDIDENTLLVPMGIDQEEIIKNKFKAKHILFSELANGNRMTYKINWQSSEAKINEQLRSMVRDFYNLAPQIISNIYRVFPTLVNKY